MRSKDNESDPELENLDSTVIAIPLLKQMKEAKDSAQKLDVIVEINLVHPSSRSATFSEVARMIADVLGEKKRDPGMEEYSEHYLFARLTTDQIHRLARANEDCRHKGNKSDSRKENWSRRPIHKIWPDFDVDLLVTRSSATVKADAAQISFSASGRGIVWAIIDTGVDGGHPHFDKHRNLELDESLSHYDFSGDKPSEITDYRRLVDHHGHGTHVAGIIAGQLAKRFGGRDSMAQVRTRDWSGVNKRIECEDVGGIKGIAPECKILSLNVCDEDGKIKTSRVMAAIGYIRQVNGDGRLPRIHGVNISLGHEFDPEWFACGQSPLCVEVDRLVRLGTSVVVAAGNGGYGTVDTQFKKQIDVVLSNTLRDPANARLAITVGSTHRDMPHDYGVSYFSSKGPTGDGRMKPDLVAPGEKIISCLSRQAGSGDFGYIEQSGTSVAAPHVSGCLAAFLSIRSEFKRQPEELKEIFLSTATDLGRERYFQGHGLVDLMRAIQSV